MNHLRAWTRKQLLTAALAVALLFAQGLGLLHSIAHAGLGVPATTQAEASSASDEAGNKLSGLFDSRHSCSTFDALTLASALVALGLAKLFFARGHAPLHLRLPTPPALPPPRHFHPRAPPAPVV